MARQTRTLRTAFAPLRNTRKSDEVFDQIAEFIRNERFEPGVKLPAERELASIFNNSRPTVREALQRAALVGLIEVRHGAGSFVKALSPREPTDRLLIEVIEKDAHRISELFEIRRALEGWCAAQAAKVARAADLAAMKAWLDDMKGLDAKGEHWERNEVAFHHALAAATGNPIAVRIMGILREGFSAFCRLKRFMPNREQQQLIWQHHADIYVAVKRRSPEDARAAIIAHMDFVESWLDEGVSNIQIDKKGR
jgi:GntR family transcriptional regulator, transcriptional repressor for pyruvate dehydrogenase complex